jgi:3-oxoacyl-[acyl-carrier protein] reductase
MGGRLQDKVAIVTGSTSGLGAATATRFAAEGARVVVTGRSEARGEAVVDAITGAGGRACFVRCNLDEESSIASLVEQSLHAYGQLDSLVMSAAATATSTGERERSILDLDNEILEHSIATNVRGQLWLFKHALPALMDSARPEQERTSSIVTIGTSGTRNGTPGMPTYWATKAPVEVMTRSLAREFGGRGVRVNCVSSGLVLTESELGAMSAEFREAVRRLNALPFFGQPDDIAAACLFLASDEARYITGTTLCVNGGAAF